MSLVSQVILGFQRVAQEVKTKAPIASPVFTGAPVSPFHRLSTEHTTTPPAAPASGVTLFARKRGRVLPVVLDPLGHDTTMQPHVGMNRVAEWEPVWNVASVITSALPATVVNAGGTTVTAVTPAATNILAAAARFRLASTATAGTGGGIRGTVTPYFLSSTANLGGFDFKCRFGFNTAPAAGSRSFVGLHTSTAQIIASANPSALLNMIGVGWDSTDSAMQMMSNDGSGTATKVATGMAPAAGEIYELHLYAQPGSGLVVQWALRAVGAGTLAAGTITTDLPAVSTMMTPHVAVGNAALAAAHSIDMVSMYIETDN